jgi:hypothetical protein
VDSVSPHPKKLEKQFVIETLSLGSVWEKRNQRKIICFHIYLNILVRGQKSLLVAFFGFWMNRVTSYWRGNRQIEIMNETWYVTRCNGNTELLAERIQDSERWKSGLSTWKFHWNLLTATVRKQRCTERLEMRFWWFCVRHWTGWCMR